MILPQIVTTNLLVSQFVKIQTNPGNLFILSYLKNGIFYLNMIDKLE